MKLQDLLNSHIGIALGLGLSRMIQPRIGYPFSRWIADILARRQHNLMVRSVRANQWVLHDEQVSVQQLNTLVHATFRSTARSLYEFWHYFRDPQIVLDMVEFDPSFNELYDQAKKGDKGTLLVVPHLSNFDLIGRALALRGLDLHILSYPQPPGGYRRQNEIRQLPGLKVTPMSIQALGEASQTLRANKVVLTGVDRPLPASEAKYRPRFFGRPAAMPVFYIRLALKHNLPITVLGACRKPTGNYYIWASDPIPMQRHPDLVQETVQNAETVLNVLAGFIKKSPEQWAMFYPVWPETLDQVPS